MQQNMRKRRIYVSHCAEEANIPKVCSRVCQGTGKTKCIEKCSGIRGKDPTSPHVDRPIDWAPSWYSFISWIQKMHSQEYFIEMLSYFAWHTPCLFGNPILTSWAAGRFCEIFSKFCYSSYNVQCIKRCAFWRPTWWCAKVVEYITSDWVTELKP